MYLDGRWLRRTALVRIEARARNHQGFMCHWRWIRPPLSHAMSGGQESRGAACSAEDRRTPKDEPHDSACDFVDHSLATGDCGLT